MLGPRELEARNASLVGGAINGGTSQLHQELVFRPVPGLGRAETGVPGLYLGSSSAHPGGGVHGAAGMNAARAALAHDRLRRPWRMLVGEPGPTGAGLRAPGVPQAERAEWIVAGSRSEAMACVGRAEAPREVCELPLGRH